MNQLFDGLDNIFGKLNGDLRERLQAVLDNPNEHTWSNAYSIILSWRRHYTLWQAVMAVDPTFPNVGPRTDAHGKQVTSWLRIPDRDTLIKAILLASELKGAQQ